MIATAPLAEALDRDGYALVRGVLSEAERTELAALYDAAPEGFRATVIMQRHGYGQGEYKYFARPLPRLVQTLRERLYGALAPIANAWAERLGEARRWPRTLEELQALCAAAGQTKPTPLLLRYRPGDHNRLHQDLYGELVFPLQAIALLDAPGRDFEGGELVLVENRARMQSRPIVVPWREGDVVVIPVRERPVETPRGWVKAAIRHGVSEVRRGERRTLGVIFHDAA